MTGLPTPSPGAVLRRLAFVVSAVIATPAGAGSAQAQDACGCLALPAEGTYGKGEPLVLSYADGDADSCPTAIHVSGPRQGGDSVDVMLRCPPGRSVWEGEEVTRVGIFKWRVSPKVEVPKVMDPGQYAVLGAAQGLSTTIDINLKLPGMIKSVGKADRSLARVRTLPWRPTSGIASQVARARKHTVRSVR